MVKEEENSCNSCNSWLRGFGCKDLKASHELHELARIKENNG